MSHLERITRLNGSSRFHRSNIYERDLYISLGLLAFLSLFFSLSLLGHLGWWNSVRCWLLWALGWGITEEIFSVLKVSLNANINSFLELFSINNCIMLAIGTNTGRVRLLLLQHDFRFLFSFTILSISMNLLRYITDLRKVWILFWNIGSFSILTRWIYRFNIYILVRKMVHKLLFWHLDMLKKQFFLLPDLMTFNLRHCSYRRRTLS